ncbi:hypothetical protein [Xylella fastidiosa]|nr:hypothetical protein [Xylella fastidiosa]
MSSCVQGSPHVCSAGMTERRRSFESSMFVLVACIDALHEYV